MKTTDDPRTEFEKQRGYSIGQIRVFRQLRASDEAASKDPPLNCQNCGRLMAKYKNHLSGWAMFCDICNGEN